MAITLIVSESFSLAVAGTPVADSLSGGGVGIDMGSCINSQFCPITDQATNVGRKDIVIQHNAVVDPITDVKFYMGIYGGITGYTYGGPGVRSALIDYNHMKSMGNSSGSSKNNNDGLSSGFWIDQRWNASDAQQFDKGAFAAQVKIFGDNATDGIDLASAFPLHVDALSYNVAGTETDATAPVTGKIGRLTGAGAPDTALGTYAHIRARQYLADAFAEGGIFQFEFVIAFSYTA